MSTNIINPTKKIFNMENFEVYQERKNLIWKILK